MPSRREELELVPVVAPASNSTPAMSRNWRWASSRNCAKPVSLQAEAQQITAGLEQQHEAELARRQAALDAMARAAQTQQLINAANRPVMTHLGTMTNCTGC